jgi:formate hydrogenlyase subunit 3/multisubunit Na+/H+ antiporter MnhD subunit
VRQSSATFGLGSGGLVVIGSGAILVGATTLLLLLISFEIMLLAALALLRNTSKSERALEALSEMFLWALGGSALLIMGFVMYSGGGLWYAGSGQFALYAAEGASYLLLMGFGVKIPLWPFISWLLKAHVEASTEFSILLSGFLVKFGIWGLVRVGELGDFAGWAQVVTCVALIGILEAVARIGAQVDLKRIVALTTVVEANWMALCLVSGVAALETVGYWLLFMHCLTTTSEFYLVEALYRRYGTRNILCMGGLGHTHPTLWRLSIGVVLVTIGFPGSSLFAAKMVFLTSMAGVSLTLFVVLGFFFLVVLPLVFMRIWVPIWFGQGHRAGGGDLTLHEALAIGIPLLGSLLLGFGPVGLGATRWD